MKKINVWAGILGKNKIGSLFYTKNLSGDAYLKMIQGTFDSLNKQVIKKIVLSPDEQLISEDKVIFQHDDCPTHFLKKRARLFKLKLS